MRAPSTGSSAQPARASRQCEPAVADQSIYKNCRVHIVQGHQMCRCAVVSGARGSIDQSPKYDATGSLPSQDSWLSTFLRGGSDGPGSIGSSSSVSSGSGSPGGMAANSVRGGSGSNGGGPRGGNGGAGSSSVGSGSDASSGAGGRGNPGNDKGS